VQHLEPIEFVHMTHSYVRGNWRNSKETSPIILAKCSHDTDILRWLINEPAKKYNASATLLGLKKEKCATRQHR